MKKNKIKTILLLEEIPKATNKKSNEQRDTTNMSKIEGDEFAEQPELGLKILTPDQMLSRLPIPLAQLKAGNNS